MTSFKTVVYLGVIGSGKTYRTTQLINEQSYTKISVADKLRSVMWAIIGKEPATTFDYSWFKGDEIDFFRLGNPVTGRVVLQNLGETFKDLFGRDYWANQWLERVSALAFNAKGDYSYKYDSEGYSKVQEFEQTMNVVCDDVRFPEEVEAAIKLNASFIFCNYKSTSYCEDSKHISERYAQALLAMGYEDGQEIKIEDLITINKNFYL